MVDPNAEIKNSLKPDVLVDAILAKKNLGTSTKDALLVIGLGPGFTAKKDVHVVIETNRGHHLGRMLLTGEAQPNTGVPGKIAGFAADRVFRAPGGGKFLNVRKIGDLVQAGDVVATVNNEPVKALISGVVRGLLRDGTEVYQGMKAGDIDPRGKKGNCYPISDKARAIGGGVLEAILYHFNRNEDRRAEVIRTQRGRGAGGSPRNRKSCTICGISSNSISEAGMCLSTVYVNVGDEQKEVMKDVARVEAEGEGFWLINLFGEKTFIKGTIQTINLMDGHFVMLEGAKTS